MNRAVKVLMFQVPGFLVAGLSVLWAVLLMLWRLDGRDTTAWLGLWPWALGLLLGGSIWAAIPAGADGDRTRG